jgi:hypothetical protein
MPKATTKPVSTPVPATTDLTDAQAKQLAEQIIKLQASRGTQIMSSVGELLFVAVYGSNEALYHSSDPTKGQSLASSDGGVLPDPRGGDRGGQGRARQASPPSAVQGRRAEA